MDLPPYPSDLADGDALVVAVGGFWGDLYDDGGLVAALLRGRARLAEDLDLRAAGAAAAASRLTTPPLRPRLWLPLPLRAADRNAGGRPGYGAWGRLGDPGRFFGGTTDAARTWYPLPPGVAAAPAVCDRLGRAARVLVDGVDYRVERGAIGFVRDPLADPAFARADGPDGPAAAAWLYRPGADFGDLRRLWGAPLGLAPASTPAARDALNAAYDAVTQGTTADAVARLVGAACGAPFAAAAETVEAVLRGPDRLWVVTDRAAYAAGPLAAPLVAPGDAVAPGQALTDAAVRHELAGGRLPAGCRGLTVPAAFLPAGVRGPLWFPNAAVPVTAATADGRTRVEWPLGGAPADARAFWAAVHAAGAGGVTLAAVLAGDPPRADVGPPAVPPTVNPALFLAATLWRANAWLLALRPRGFGPGAAGPALLYAALRGAVPPHTAVLLTVERDDLSDTLDPARVGEAAAGGPFPTHPADALDPALVAERVVATSEADLCP